MKLATGKSIRSFQRGEKAKRSFNITQIGLECDRDFLYSRINKRVDNMIESGLIEETVSLYPQKQLSALQTVGYRELFDWMDGLLSKERAIELIKTNTRHYAKRQMTWFKNQSNLKWFQHPFNIDEILRHCVSFTHYAAK